MLQHISNKISPLYSWKFLLIMSSNNIHLPKDAKADMQRRDRAFKVALSL